MVKILLHAGADPKIRAKTGENALDQAKRFKYAHIQTALETADARTLCGAVNPGGSLLSAGFFVRQTEPP
jgi:hypothetical protein